MAMQSATNVAAVETALASSTDSTAAMAAAKVAYAAASRRRALQSSAAAGSLQALAQQSQPTCDRWAQFDTYYASGKYDNFLDGFITAALDGTLDFAGLSTMGGRVEAVKKGVQDQLLVKEIICAISGSNGDQAANWDMAYAYFMGTNSGEHTCCTAYICFCHTVSAYHIAHPIYTRIAFCVLIMRGRACGLGLSTYVCAVVLPKSQSLPSPYQSYTTYRC
jgi:hypothetical protein